MKIALIEDRKSRMERYAADLDFLQSSKTVSIITGADFDTLTLALSKGTTDVLKEYDCIALHRSALSIEIIDTIKGYCKLKKKPLIFFSGGISSNVFKDTDYPFLQINAKDFYSSNLTLFLENCEQSKAVNLLILQFGKRWKLSLLLDIRNHIAVAQNTKSEILIKRVKDLKVNSLIKSEITAKTKDVPFDNDFASINAEQIRKVKEIIDQLIYETI
ncbi:MAG: hypothetical protein QM528_04925 [Phycisphaerales bacterium]|nr:hypothetical protein [Phycisphaerales bacterium]